jgi:hypothetical protein
MRLDSSGECRPGDPQTLPLSLHRPRRAADSVFGVRGPPNSSFKGRRDEVRVFCDRRQGPALGVSQQVVSQARAETSRCR